MIDIPDSVLDEFCKHYFTKENMPSDELKSSLREEFRGFLIDACSALNGLNIASVAFALWTHKHGNPGAFFSSGFAQAQAEKFADAAATMEARHHAKDI